MKLLLLGASGMIGSRILTEALTRGHNVRAAARTPDRIAAADGVETVALDANDAAALADAAKDVDVIISALSPRSTGNAIEEALTFTRALIDAQRRTGKRLVTVGGASSLHLADGTSVLTQTPQAIVPEATGMRWAYGLLTLEDVDFVVLAPSGQIAPGARTGSFRLGGRTLLTDAAGAPGNISAEDFAVALLDEVERPAHFRTIVAVGY